MFFEDARSLTVPAVRLLESQREALGCPDLKIWSLADFSSYAKEHGLTRHQKETIVDQATFLIDQFYAHLPFKRARYATDPVQSLRLIRAQLDRLNDLDFHEQMLATMVELRDAHTFYSLPEPYQGAFAFLPFQMRCFEQRSGKRKYIVTNIIDGFEHKLFGANVEITSWNGVPIEQAVEREGLQDVGANPSSRRARSIGRMCSRPLALSLPPKENYIVIGYKSAKGSDDESGIVMPWYICSNGIHAKKRNGSASSLNEGMAQAARARKILFHRSTLAPFPGTPDPRHESNYPDVFSFQFTGGLNGPGSVDPSALRDRAHPDKKFGYVQIRTFDLEDGKFAAEFQRILLLLREAGPDGLILDVRSNPGGSIQAAERVLQFLTPGSIRPANFHFISSQTTRQIATVLDNRKDAPSAHQMEWHRWVGDLLKSITNGDAMTPGYPLTATDDCMDTGQIYQGPVTLIIDSLAYSATDIFCAGFQDHRIGKIIGVDENTGGGGANRWLHGELLDNLHLHGLHGFPLEPLPAGAELGLAIRRCSRVGERAGNPIEDEGVKADIAYCVTRQDLLNNSCDLLAFACEHLGSLAAYSLNIKKAELTADGLEVIVTSGNLFRLELQVNGFNQGSFKARGGESR